jgi:excisionase family DNA binding protein
MNRKPADNEAEVIHIVRTAFTRKEAAESMGFSLTTIDKLISSGKLRVIRAGKSVRIPATAIEEFLAA